MFNLDEIIDFILKEGNGLYQQTERQTLEEIIRKHLEYGTAMVIRDKDTNNIVGVARWNMRDENIAHILDVIVAKDFRDFRLLKYMLALGVSKNPNAKWFYYERESKYPKRERKIFNINRFLRRKVK